MPQRICACPEESLKVRRERLQQHRQQQQQQPQSRSIDITDDGAAVSIGVVVHICFETTNQAHYQDEVDWMIAELNKDFAKQATNFDGIGSTFASGLRSTFTDYVGRAADTKIIFTKQQVLFAPIGSQASTNLATLDTNIKGPSPALTPSSTLNVWVAELSSGILGYAQFPWDLGSRPDTDGVVLARGVFGRCAHFSDFDRNKTLTHEVGHWLGLYHTFQSTHAYGGGDIDYSPSDDVQETKGDLVIDTPPQGTPTYGNPYTSPNSWPTSSPTDVTGSHRHMFMNFMDYSDDVAMFMFTGDQSAKMRLMMFIYRPGLVPGFSGNLPVEPDWENDFEFGSDNWVFRTRNSPNDAQLVTGAGVGGSRALRLRKRADALSTIDLNGVTSTSVSIKTHSTGPAAKFYARPIGSTWAFVHQFTDRNTYGEESFALPGPFGAGYKILIRADPGNNYGYFDDLVIE